MDEAERRNYGLSVGFGTILDMWMNKVLGFETGGFCEWPVVGRILRRINMDLELVGVHEVSRRLVKKMSRKLDCNCEKESKRALSNKAVVVVANHPAEIDPVVLTAALPERNDAYLIIDATFLKIFPSLKKRLIPVYIQNNKKKEEGTRIRDRLVKKMVSYRCEDEEEGRRNRQSISRASKKLEEGGMVVIFPAGPGGKWYSGVGHMIAGVKEGKDVCVVMADIRGTCGWDVLRLVPGLRRLLPSFKVKFSKPKWINGQRKDARRLATALEREYYSWAEPGERLPFFVKFANQCSCVTASRHR